MTLPGPLPANYTTGAAFTAADENLDETTINALLTAVTALQATQLSRLVILATTAVTLSAGATVTLTTGGSATIPAVCDITCLIESGGAPTLPTAVGNTNRYMFINASGSVATVAASSSQTIEGSALPLTLPVNASIGLISDNTGWWIT